MCQKHADVHGTAQVFTLVPLRVAQVVPAAWLRLFNPAEVNELLSGGAGGGADADDMRAHATYSGGYSDTSRTIALFWQARMAPLHCTCRRPTNVSDDTGRLRMH